ncbi:MAG: histidine kinase, partial [Marinobacter sp.]|nr:histidine kinase [Marinobacter sp.]
MTPSIKAVPQSWTMDRLARFLTDNEITGSPVTDETGEIVGIATLKDITEFRWNASRSESDARMTQEEEQEARRLRMAIFEEMGKVPVEVRDIMTPIVLSVDEQTPVRDIADIMMREHLHRIFITKDEKITGIVTTYDMLKLISDQELTNRCAGNG